MHNIPSNNALKTPMPWWSHHGVEDHVEKWINCPITTSHCLHCLHGPTCTMYRMVILIFSSKMKMSCSQCEVLFGRPNTLSISDLQAFSFWYWKWGRTPQKKTYTCYIFIPKIGRPTIRTWALQKCSRPRPNWCFEWWYLIIVCETFIQCIIDWLSDD